MDMQLLVEIIIGAIVLVVAWRLFKGLLRLALTVGVIALVIYLLVTYAR